MSGQEIRQKKINYLIATIKTNYWIHDMIAKDKSEHKTFKRLQGRLRRELKKLKEEG